jgi:hypothetical protein
MPFDRALSFMLQSMNVRGARSRELRWKPRPTVLVDTFADDVELGRNFVPKKDSQAAEAQS